MPNARRAHDTLRRLLEIHLNDRCRQYPESARPGRVGAIAELLADAGSRMPACALRALADLGLAIQAFDGLVHESQISIGDLALRAEQLAACARGRHCAEVVYDPTARLLSSVALQLADSPLGPRLFSEWERASSEMLAAMVARRSTGEKSAAIAVAAAILVGDAALANERDAIVTVISHAARAVRFAGDRRAVEEERRELGRALDALSDLAWLFARFVERLVALAADGSPRGALLIG